MSEQFETASPDGFIQEQQRQRVQKFKRLAWVLAALTLAAIGMTIWLFLSGNEEVPVAKAVVENTQSSAEQEAAREKFKQALADFELNVAPVLTRISHGQWATSQVAGLFDEKERALALFANAGFLQALGILQRVEEDAKALIAQWRQAYEDKLNEAQSYYTQGQIQQARLALSQADKIKPLDEQSTTLRAQLSAYEKVQGLLAQLAVARVENNLENQVALMQQVLQADPTRQDMQEPLQAAISQLNERRLALSLGKAQQALERGDIGEANTYIQQAQRIKPEAKGIIALRTELDKRQATQSLSDVKSEVATLALSDAWPEALSVASRGLSRFPRDAELQQSHAQATQILSAQRNIESFNAQPQRLADENIRQAAQNAIQQSILLLPLSNTLAQRAQRLAGFIDQYATKVPVTVLSDGMTRISVIGTGIVGVVERKVIDLSPGEYIFEGKREGFRSKRITVNVNIGTPSTVSLICDEPLT